LGLFLGSALNRLVSRLPVFLQMQWQAECVSSEHGIPILTTTEMANTARLRPCCPHCQSTFKAMDSVPVVSFILLRGRCRDCKQSLNWRDPWVEVLTGLLFAASVLVWGVSWQTLCAVLFASSLLALALIDWDSALLPDLITQPLVWSGLMVSAWRVSHVPLEQSLAGAVLGYLFLWLLNGTFKLITGKEGMGHGDFKLTAALGAWLGVAALMPVLVIATFSGAAFGVFQKIRRGQSDPGYFPFGPFLALAGVLVLFGSSYSRFMQ